MTKRYEKFEKWMIGKTVRDGGGDKGVVTREYADSNQCVWVEWEHPGIGEAWIEVDSLVFLNAEVKYESEALIFANDRPSEIGDDLYQWATDAEDMIRRLHARVQELDVSNRFTGIVAKYIIEHSVEYYGNACSCCDPTPFDCYHVKDAETGQYFGCDDEHYGFTALQYAYKEEALEAILEKLGVEVECIYEEEHE